MANTVTVDVGVVVLGAFGAVWGVLMWLLKRSIFGRMDEMEKDMENLQSKPLCILMQTSCQNLLAERMDKVSKVTNEKIESIEDKVDLVLERQSQVIERIDAHVNGHNH